VHKLTPFLKPRDDGWACDGQYRAAMGEFLLIASGMLSRRTLVAPREEQPA
jgi:hypothetical protein